MKNSFLLEQSSETGKDANLILRQYKIDLYRK